MKVQVNVEQVNILKKKGKIVLSFDKEQATAFMEFLDKPCTMELLVDAEARQKQLGMISEDQNKKIYAILSEISAHLGYGVEELKSVLKPEFSPDQPFSIGSMSRKEAGDFITFLIEFGLDQGAPLKENPKAYLDDDARLLSIMQEQKLCIICGTPADLHHVTAVGMGRDRSEVKDSESVMLPLCRRHHSECHQLGAETFAKKYALQVYFGQ